MQPCQVYPYLKAVHPFYACWYNLHQRCKNPDNANFKHYGGRGVIIADSWDTFANFYNDMFSGWKRGLEIDRKDNNAGYSKDNCHWVTRAVNCRNTRSTKLTASDVASIRALYGSMSNEALGKRFNISASHICRIYHREKWAA